MMAAIALAVGLALAIGINSFAGTDGSEGDEQCRKPGSQSSRYEDR
jgi:hypothetical protein